MINVLYKHSFTTEPRSVSRDTGGAMSDSYGTAVSSYGYFRPLDDEHQIRDEQRQVVANWRLYCPIAVSIAEGDRITYNGRAYRVTGLRDMSRGNNQHKEVNLLYVG